MFNGTTWIFHDTVTLPEAELRAWNSAFSTLYTTPIIKANTYNYYGIIVKTDGIYLENSDGSYSMNKIYDNGAWTDESYKTIEFINEPDSFIVGNKTTGDPSAFLLWLQENAAQQPEISEKYLAEGEDLRKIADMIRAKTGESEPIVFPSGFLDGIGEIQLFTEQTTAGTALPTSGTTINGKETASIGGISINNAKAIKGVACSGLPEGATFLYRIVTNTSSISVNCYLYNSTTAPIGVLQASLTVTITYYR